MMEPVLKDNEYRCCECGGIFEKGWTDEEAAEELKSTFGKPDTSDCDMMCDDCYNKFMSKIFN